MLALALAGCTDGGDGQLPDPAFTEVATDAPSEDSSNEDVTPAAGSPRAFVFESGVLEFGDFDPYALGDDLFNPCTEITEAEYAEAGFERLPEFDSIEYLNELSFCEVASESDLVSISFSNGTLDREKLDQMGVIYNGHSSSILPELYVYGPASGVEGDCFAQIDTLKGGFGAAVSGSPYSMTQNDICQIAIEKTEQMFLTHGRN